MKIIKISSLILFIVLAIMGVVAFLMEEGFIFLFGITFGFVAVFYLIIYLLLYFLQENTNKLFFYITYILFFIPIVWVIIDAEGLFEFLLQGVELNMR